MTRRDTNLAQNCLARVDRPAHHQPAATPVSHPDCRSALIQIVALHAMKGVGGVGFTPAEAGTIHRVAEIDALQKSAAVAQRLAALKAGRAA